MRRVVISLSEVDSNNHSPYRLVEDVYLDFEKVTLSEVSFRTRRVASATFLARELVIENTALEILDACAFPNIESLTVSENDDMWTYTPPTDFISSENVSNLLFLFHDHKFPNLKHLTFPNAELKEGTRFTIFEEIKRTTGLETVHITVLHPQFEDLADMNCSVDQDYFKELAVSLPNLHHIEIHLPKKAPYIFYSSDLNQLRNA
ncbi:hypothetical protein TRICI_003236 [Trichomonascus ciferrii]|uniref:Uncharacterized protein n=1 Tax=Trichomonascus ciferrii TaxID=44093 RepID=A0A642V5N4_9ASCO|nr:hypothetical protein TRICI_003236 [Trichomonascus ciferrii]